MTHDWSHLDEAAAKAVDEESRHRIFTTDGVAVACRNAIIAAITPSDLAALIAEKCPGWVAVPVVPSTKMAAVGWAEQESGGNAIDIFMAMAASSE